MVGRHPLMPHSAQRVVRAVGAGLILRIPVRSRNAGPNTHSTAPAAAAPLPVAPPPDPLGRDTPRGSVLGFLNAARKGEDEIAAQYLSTRLKGPARGDARAPTVCRPRCAAAGPPDAGRATHPKGRGRIRSSRTRKSWERFRPPTAPIDIVVERVHGTGREADLAVLSGDTGRRPDALQRGDVRPRARERCRAS